MNNFTPIRNGILDHITEGNLCPFDLGIYVFLHLRADWSNGTYHGCALTIAHQFNDPGLKEHIQKSLRRLRDRQYINYPKGEGKRGAYPILINKYQVTVGKLLGQRLNAWKYGELCQPSYERQNGDGRVEEGSRKGDGTVVAPIQDLLDIQDNQNPLSEQSSDGGGVPVKQKRKPCHDAEELALLLMEEIHRNKADYRITQAQQSEWAVTADRMIRLDNRNPEQIADLIRWVQRDEFWLRNVLSMDTLRKKFDQLELKRQHNGHAAAPGRNVSGFQPAPHRAPEDLPLRELVEAQRRANAN